MKLKIPPVIVALAAGCLMWGTNELLHPELMLFSTPNWLDRVILGVGLIVAFSSLIQFLLNKTSADPHRPDKASVLVVGGIYRISRNPMYLAILLLLAVFGLKLGNLFVLGWIPLFVWYMNRYQIKPEEEVLLEKFGSEYETYKSTVRRWL